MDFHLILNPFIMMTRLYKNQGQITGIGILFIEIRCHL